MKALAGYFSLWLKKNTFLLWALAVIHLIFFLLALRNGNIAFSVDSTEYLNQAENIREHASWYAGSSSTPHDDFLESRRPPLYGFFIFLVHIVSSNNFFLLALQNLMSIAVLILTAFMFWLLTGKRIANQWLVILPLLLFPTQFVYANMIMADVLFQFLIISGFLFFIQSVRRPDSFLYFCIFISLAILTKPVFYAFCLIVPVIALLFYTKGIYKLSNVYISLIPLLTVATISTINYSKTGYFHYSSVNEKFISEYGAYLAVGDKGDISAQQKIDSLLSEANKQPDFKSYCKYINKESLFLIKENKARFVMMQLKGMANFFIDHGRFDLMAFFVNPDYVQTEGWKQKYEEQGWQGVFSYLKTFNPFLLLFLILASVFNLIMVVVLVRFLFAHKIAILFRLLLLLFVIYMVVFTGVVGCSRYRMAIFPIIWMAFMWFLTERKSVHHKTVV